MSAKKITPEELNIPLSEKQIGHWNNLMMEVDQINKYLARTQQKVSLFLDLVLDQHGVEVPKNAASFNFVDNALVWKIK